MLGRVIDINKDYGKGNNLVNALKGINFSFNEKEFIALCGPSGSGKTTLLTIIAGLHHPTSGKIEIDGISLYEELGSERLAIFRSEYIGFVFQSFYLVSYLTALQNVMLPLAHQDYSTQEKKKMAMKALEKVGLQDRANHLPSELSGGQSQRVAVARALVNEPKIIFADEPTGNLDSATRDEILGLFQDVRDQGHTIIMVTHDVENIKKVDRVIYIRDGFLVE
jgi:putative ABC transport system ATP-binding protein